MTNFDFLRDEPKFKSFADTAIAAERIFSIDESASVLNCRRAMEFAIKWMYSVDSSLTKTWDDKLVSLMSAEDFRDLVDNEIQRLIQENGYRRSRRRCVWKICLFSWIM